MEKSGWDYSTGHDEWRLSERLRQLKCPYEDVDFATMDSEGHMYVHPHFTRYPNVTTDVKCKVIFLEGGIRNSSTNQGASQFAEVGSVEAPENARFFVNADAFYIRCHQKDKQDTESFDKFGGPRKKQSVIKEKPKRYSIDILAFDSTSRLMFMRHVPRTLELMNKLGYEILYGYNKVCCLIVGYIDKKIML
ncbi:hypothetical protein COOONC_14401 [Cooperia oncophora]